ncbi:MAG: Holliday junction branch migration protein RuvA [Planctomycetota bacterium]|nr:Holliday junction branch migration protein RuvA [Planctomycetota bacterium]
MFHHVRGALIRKFPNEAVVEAGGVGYQLLIPLGTYQALPALGQPVTLFAHLHVTDDALTLFGFATEAERVFFRQLTGTVKGVGPRVALAILSGGRIEHLQQAIRLGDVATLKAIKGVGEATAKRIVLELGKILVRQDEAAAGKMPARAPASAPAEPLMALDEWTELAVKAVAKLNEVPNDVALKAVQRAWDDLRAQGRKPAAVQDLIGRALPYAE